MSDDKAPTSPTAGSGAAPANSPAKQCTTCTVTLNAKDIKICGANKTRDVKATGTPGGGSYTFSSGDPDVASVTGSDDTGTIKAKKQGTSTIKVTYNVAGCSPCTDTAVVKTCICNPKSGGGRFYAYAQKSKANLNGGKAKIKTHYGKLCCEDMGCTDLGKNNAYVNISSGGKWAQTGYRRIRNDGSTTYTKMRYTEMNGAVYKRKDDTAGAPAEGTTHEYRIELDTATGTWDYLFDGTSWSTFLDNGWKDTSGSVVQWPGELVNKEDDMMGTSADKCNFTECQYRTTAKADFVDAGITATDLRTDDSSEWGIELVSGTAFNIWDKNPN